MQAIFALSLAAASVAHVSDFALCTAANGCVAAEPLWVAKFSQAAAGPEQFWINYGATPDVMVIGWITADMTAPSTVQYGTTSGSYTHTASGNASSYTYSAKYTSGLIHHTPLSGLAPATKYYYLVAGSTTEYSFTSAPLPSTFPYAMGIFADIGENNNADETVQHMIDGSAHLDSYLLNGDISYASGCESSGCTTWDAFQRMMSPLASVKPIAIAIGNHEQYDTANGIVAISSQYRFKGMPTGGRTDGCMYYSYQVGPAHIISLASFYPGGFAPSSPLTQWLAKDLASIDRAVSPWVLVSLHAPWYNSNAAHQGDGESMRAQLEAMLVKGGVSAFFTGHVHAYERSYPVVNNAVVAPGAGPIHFNIGDAGAGLYTSWKPTPAWSAFHSAAFGHGEFQMLNATHALWTWHRNSDGEDTIADSVYVINTQ